VGKSERAGCFQQERIKEETSEFLPKIIDTDI
jgi:hypothetical protein